VSERSKDRLRFTHQLDQSSLPTALFHERLLERGDTEQRQDGWATSKREIPALGETLFRFATHGGESVLTEVDGVLLQLNLYSGRLYFEVSAASADAITPIVERLREEFPAPDPSSAHEVTVTFWTYSPNGPMPSWRSIAVPSWDEIRKNYSADTRAALEQLMSGWQPAHGGQLVLWHGVAGTGKTFGLRALAWEWREWCDFHYIVDPDTFFGQHADYLMSVLLQPDYVQRSVPSIHGFIGRGALMSRLVAYGDGEDDEEDTEDGAGKAWRVLVLEDTGELLTPDARAMIGQGLSRFLNVVDGLIGQGLRVLVLVTTNEPIRKLHPAVARPGRCAANIEFLSLGKQEVSDWLADHELDVGDARPATLAELYARLEGRDPRDLRLVGFADDGH
jgi:hypothetical protein